MVGHNNYAADRLAQVFGIDHCRQSDGQVQVCVLPPLMVSVTQHFEFDCCLFIFLISSMNDFYLILFQLKYHESGMEKIVAPSDGQWNMINKAILDVGELDFLI